MSDRHDRRDASPDAGSAEVVRHPSEEVSTLGFIRRVFDDGDASAWLLHVATGQVLWANARALEVEAGARAKRESGPSQDAHARLLAAHGNGRRVREQAVSIDGYSLTLFVAVEKKLAASTWGRSPSVDVRTSRAWWIDQRQFTPALASVAALLVRGATAEDIARELEITATSARTYIQRVRERLPDNELWWITRRSHVDA